jgi:hypothetical protein
VKFYYVGYGEEEGPFVGAVIVRALDLSSATINASCICSEEPECVIYVAHVVSEMVEGVAIPEEFVGVFMGAGSVKLDRLVDWSIGL